VHNGKKFYSAVCDRTDIGHKLGESRHASFKGHAVQAALEKAPARLLRSGAPGQHPRREANLWNYRPALRNIEAHRFKARAHVAAKSAPWCSI